MLPHNYRESLAIDGDGLKLFCDIIISTFVPRFLCHANEGNFLLQIIIFFMMAFICNYMQVACFFFGDS